MRTVIVVNPCAIYQPRIMQRPGQELDQRNWYLCRGLAMDLVEHHPDALHRVSVVLSCFSTTMQMNGRRAPEKKWTIGID
jgi:hypothetical protein